MFLSYTKPLESEGIKIGIVKCFPKGKILYGITIAHPIAYNTIGISNVFLFGSVRAKWEIGAGYLGDRCRISSREVALFLTQTTGFPYSNYRFSLLKPIVNL